MRVSYGEFAEQIVRMLSVMDRAPAKLFTGLIKQWVSVTALKNGIEAEHSTKADLRLFVERLGIHGHKHRRSIGPVSITFAGSRYVAARTDARITQKGGAHEHPHAPVLVHLHLCVHWGRIGGPRCSRALALHWVADIAHGRHFHFHRSVIHARHV